MPRTPALDLSVSVLLPHPASEVFQSLIDELSTSLHGAHLRLEPGPHGRLVEELPGRPPVEVARITRWDPFHGIAFQWHPPEWAKVEPTHVEVRLEPEDQGTRVTIEHRGWGRAVGGEGGEELVGWFASEVGATLFRSTSPARLADWLTDRKARRPSGATSRATYREPTYHLPNFLLILERLGLTGQDRLLEVGCGGGAFLRRALESGCTASAIDHSVDLLKVAAEQNAAAIAGRRLNLVHGEVDVLPFPNASFTCAVMTGVLGFLPEPQATFREIFRTLRPGGRMAVYAGTKALRGTPAAPEPVAERVHWYEDAELAQLVRSAGFTGVRIEHPVLAPYARRAGLPAEAVAFFERPEGSQFLWAIKPGAARAPPRRHRAPTRKGGDRPTTRSRRS